VRARVEVAQGRIGRQTVEVYASTERATFAGEHDATHVAPRRQLLDGVGQRQEHRVIQRIQLLWPGEADIRDTRIDCDCHSIGHAPFSLIRNFAS
jgi:hypothetical protein